MKKGWEVKKLGEVFDIERGGSPRPIDSFLTNSPDGINWIKIGDTKGVTKYIYQTKEKIKPEGAKRSRVVNDGDFILSNSMSFGHPYIMKTTGCIHDGWLVLREKEPGIDKDFLYYVLDSDLICQQFDNLASGATVRNLNIELAKKVKIPLPPLPEQLRIVAILDKAFAAIAAAKANAEKNLQNARELFESYGEDIFANPGEGWEEKKLGDKTLLKIIDGDRGKNYPKRADFYEEGYCLFLNTGNVRPDGFIFESTAFINEKKDKALGNGKLNRNDVVMTTRGTIGNVAVFSDDVDYHNIRINSGMLIFRPNLKFITSEYLFEIFRSGITKAQIDKHVSGAAQPQLPIKTLVNFTIPVPKSLSEQRSIVAKLDALSSETKKLEAIYQKKLADLDEMKKSILQKAFSGELTG